MSLLLYRTLIFIIFLSFIYVIHRLYLNSTTGTITIQYAGDKEFDRETISVHYLTVEARDNLGQGNRNTVQIILTIDDVNDNFPFFLDTKYEANLYENKLNFENSILQIRAKDVDLNNLISYEILDNNDFVQNFSIDRINGIITPIQPLDFESLASENEEYVKGNVQPIYLTITARDNGVPSLTSNITVIIYLHDVNDFSPKFERDLYSVTIPETIEGGSSIVRVRVFFVILAWILAKIYSYSNFRYLHSMKTDLLQIIK